jgi:hypothetical protein
MFKGDSAKPENQLFKLPRIALKVPMGGWWWWVGCLESEFSD